MLKKLLVNLIIFPLKDFLFCRPNVILLHRNSFKNYKNTSNKTACPSSIQQRTDIPKPPRNRKKTKRIGERKGKHCPKGLC